MEENKYLHYVTLPIITNEECKARLDPEVKATIDEKVLCLDAEEGGYGNCIGDAGSALIAKGTVVGMKFFSGICPSGGSPDVFLRISYYLPWIESVAVEPEV